MQIIGNDKYSKSLFVISARVSLDCPGEIGHPDIHSLTSLAEYLSCLYPFLYSKISSQQVSNEKVCVDRPIPSVRTFIIVATIGLATIKPDRWDLES
jgi:hypothetical protein